MSEKKMFLGATKTIFRNAVELRESMTSAEKKLWKYFQKKAIWIESKEAASDKYIHS